MDNRIIAGALVGTLVMLILSLGSLVLFARFSGDLITSTNSMLLNLVAVLMAPIAGGFVAGLIGRANPRQAGLLAGSGASFVILFSWLAITGLSLGTIISGLVIGLLWVFLSRLGAGFSIQNKPTS